MYDAELLEHNLHPLHQGVLPDATVDFEFINASCGDKMRMFLKIADGVILGATWDGKGCAISQASADVLAERLTGMSMEAARELSWTLEPVLSSVKRMPARVKCAELAWKVVEKI